MIKVIVDNQGVSLSVTVGNALNSLKLTLSNDSDINTTPLAIEVDTDQLLQVIQFVLDENATKPEPTPDPEPTDPEEEEEEEEK